MILSAWLVFNPGVNRCLGVDELNGGRQGTPKGIWNRLAILRLYMLFLVGVIPMIGVSLSASLLMLLFLEMVRGVVVLGGLQCRPLIQPALLVAVVLLLSLVVNLVLKAGGILAFEGVLGLQLPCWVLIVVLVAVVVGRTLDPEFHLKVFGWGIMVIGAIRLGPTIFRGDVIGKYWSRSTPDRFKHQVRLWSHVGFGRRLESIAFCGTANAWYRLGSRRQFVSHPISVVSWGF